VIGVLNPTSPEANVSRLSAFRQGLKEATASELGHIPEFKLLQRHAQGAGCHRQSRDYLEGVVWIVRIDNGPDAREGNRKPSKRKSTAKIDGLVSLTMAIGVARLQVKPIDIEASLPDLRRRGSGSRTPRSIGRTLRGVFVIQI
jgi:hypothetical protein